MHTIESKYCGDLRTDNLHLKSYEKIITDAPIDNNGKGEAFSPTDLVVTGLTDCILTTIAIVAKRHDFSIDGATAKTTKIMATQAPRRIAEIKIDFDFSMCNLTEKQQTIVTQSHKACPVTLSLHPDIIQNITFKF